MPIEATVAHPFHRPDGNFDVLPQARFEGTGAVHTASARRLWP